MAGPSFKPGDYEKLPKWQKVIYRIAVFLGLLFIAFFLIKSRFF
ncbi:hypothetical protein LMG19083_00715 [Ralstonia psammae]|uniref:Transmembrane protein n=1 Tax=Ralstonia psammae TaxID=3058598 RepID=A0ABN9IF50_9RALS|nr:hypothetical protein LMG19083_00715 [Ralstonia sp. LMG 19083]